MSSMIRSARYACAAVLLVALAVPSVANANVTITVVNVDGANEGFNDTTPAAPVGGNPGTTKGQQRLIAFQFAADIWGATLDSTIPIQVQAQFDALGATVLGAAAATARVRDFGGLPGFPGAAFPATWYHLALANKRAGFDFVPVIPGTTAPFPDILALFSSDFDFYLGLDGNHGSKVDLVTIVLHELGHGLGFSSFMSPLTGAVPACPPANCTDIFLRFAHDGVSQTQFSDMTTNAQRATAAAQVDNVVWTGANVAAAVPFTLNFGRPQVELLGLGSAPVITRVGAASFGAPASSHLMSVALYSLVGSNRLPPVWGTAPTVFSMSRLSFGEARLIRRTPISRVRR